MPDLATRVRGSVTWSNDRRRQDGACWVSTKRGHSRRPERKGKGGHETSVWYGKIEMLIGGNRRRRHRPNRVPRRYRQK